MNLWGHFHARLAVSSPVPIYKRLAGAIEEALRAGLLSQGEKLPSERELVARLRVSRQTVRAALADLIARKLVVSTHGRGNFVRGELPDRPLRILVPERFRSDHWGGPALHYDWIHRAEAACRCKAHYLYTPSEEQMLASLMDRSHGFDAALVFRPPHAWVNAILREKKCLLGAKALPLLIVNRDLARSGIPFVTSDHCGGAACAVGHLAGLGHRQILLLVSARDPIFTAEVVAGYRDALEDAGIPRREERILPVENATPEALAATLSAFLKRRPSTALLAGGSIFGAKLREAVDRLGLAVPGVFSVLTFTEPEASRAQEWDWTAMVQQNQAVATMAMRRLCELARGATRGPIEVRIPMRFHRGATCAAPAEEMKSHG
jgi:DNA-binding LacI/PurR family transcriptional regulator